ncbi:MAG TPA: phage virion morphogenesis protein [Crocinitomicaceae bacterium]|nr:phage virion morphogenesis protein [Crocinitomicaceae bacterium]
MANDFLKKLNHAQKVMKRMPKMVAKEAVRFSKERFQQQNWIGDTTEQWKKRKPSWSTESAKRSRRNILTDTGRLRRSIRTVSESSDKVTIGTDVPYAQIHNSGGRFTAKQNVKAHTRKRNGKEYTVKAHKRTIHVNMPKRQFIGNSQYLTKRLIRIMSAEFNKGL